MQNFTEHAFITMFRGILSFDFAVRRDEQNLAIDLVAAGERMAGSRLDRRGIGGSELFRRTRRREDQGGNHNGKQHSHGYVSSLLFP